MSCNIDSWKTKKLESLVIPIRALYPDNQKNWHPKQPKVLDVFTLVVAIDCGCGQTIKGVIKDGGLRVTGLSMDGEGSGGFYDYILKPALAQSTGKLEAILTWETGEIYRLQVGGGVVVEKPIEL